MFVKVTVLIAAISFILMLLTIIKGRFSNNSNVKEETDSATGLERTDWYERIHKLPLPQLGFKLQELEKQKVEVMNNFLSMDTAQQYDAIAQFSEIKEKIEIIKDEIKLRRLFIEHLKELSTQNSVSFEYS
jgi:hypothetical protein